MTSVNNTYLTFNLGQEVFGVNVTKVMEIREYQQPRILPQPLPFVTGVIEYLEEVIPLIDTGVKFGMAPVKIDAGTCIVVLQLVSNTLGKTYRVAVLVDNVSDVIECEESDLRQISDDYKPGYIDATLSKEDAFIYILNADQVFNQKEIISMLETLKKIK